MQEILDRQLLEDYLRENRILEFFDTQDLPFKLYRYEVGEMMNILRPTKEYLKFVVEGTFDLYAVREDGVRHLIHPCRALCLLGDLEFCGRDVGMRYQQVTRTVYCVELPVERLRLILERDVRFLNFLLKTIATKFSASTLGQGAFSSLEEALIFHLRYDCPDHAITSVSQTAFRLNYSLRQTQRVLQDLTRKDILKKTGKGKYVLNPSFHP